MLKINSIFYTIQGEGSFVGTPAIFIRLSDCNLACSFCDTEFLSGDQMDEQEILEEIFNYDCKFIVLTGGEPSMQDIGTLCELLKEEDYYITMETNGMFEPVTNKIDWICLSPKSSFKHIKLKECHDLKFVVKKGDVLPKIPKDFKHRQLFISPENETSGEHIGLKACTGLNKENLDYCVDLIKENPNWRLNLQTHKIIGVE
jgi:organic radical activating enzyme